MSVVFLGGVWFSGEYVVSLQKIVGRSSFELDGVRQNYIELDEIIRN